MKIVLERGFEHSDYQFATTTWQHGNIRWLVVNIGGKQFHVRREFTDDSVLYGSQYREKFMEYVDELLVKQMEHMLTKIFENACGAVPEGVDIDPQTGVAAK